jgi:sensor histidine kinase YesM
MKGRYTRIIIEIIASVAFIFFPLLLFPTIQPFTVNGSLNSALKGILIAHSLLIAFYFFNSYYLIPKFFFTGKRNIYGLISLSFFTLLVLIMVTDPNYNPLPSPPFKYSTFTFIFSLVLRFMVVMLFSLGITNMARLQRIEKEQVQTELAYLKAQINPHFLFNTLNSIYALTVKKSDQAPEAITRLSAIMRYVFAETVHDHVPLEKEINYVSSYIELERLRLTDKVKLSYVVDGNPAGKKIAPMILIPLIENAFKHGISTREECSIGIAINIEPKKLVLSVINSKHRSDDKNSTGLGLSNVRRRLNLLYPGKHVLRTSETIENFSAKLELESDD